VRCSNYITVNKKSSCRIMVVGRDAKDFFRHGRYGAF
jgi:hypothetical protein